MKHLVYGVAASALVLGMGGLAQACEQHAQGHAVNAALANPFVAAHATASKRGYVLAQSQDDAAKEKEEGKEKKSEAVSPAVGPLAQSQDDSAKEKGDEEKKPEMIPGRARGLVLAQAQPDGQSSTSDEESKAKSDDK